MSIEKMAIVSLDMQVEPWRSINDGVMGGRSAGGMEQTNDGLKFEGILSLENNGGFSSVRRFVEQDFTSANRVRLEVRGDGRDYQFRIRQSGRFDDVAWSARFPTSDSWVKMDISFDDFIPVFRGRPVEQAGPVVASRIQQVGFLLADRNPGRFQLDIRRIQFPGPVAQLDRGSETGGLR